MESNVTNASLVPAHPAVPFLSARTPESIALDVSSGVQVAVVVCATLPAISCLNA